MSGDSKRAAYWAGILVLALLDFLALDDITTAGAWMPEIVFVIASIPAMVTLGYRALAKPPDSRTLESGEGDGGLLPPGR